MEDDHCGYYYHSYQYRVNIHLFELVYLERRFSNSAIRASCCRKVASSVVLTANNEDFSISKSAI